MMTTKHNPTSITAEPGKQEILITREFEAPRELVFKAYTDSKLYPRWVGPRNLTMELLTFEPIEGGRWRFIHKDEHGNRYGFHGVYHEVSPPDPSSGASGRIIDTFEFEGLPDKGHVMLETVRFDSLQGNRTKLTVQSVFQSVADRDGMMRSGMERGVLDSHARLDELLAKGFDL
jgi:uncharacterized protein YndB with AHSA1/START domain